MKEKPKFKIGQKVIASDLRSRERDRTPDKHEGSGIIRDLWHPYGRQTPKKDRTAPYYVELTDGFTSWYDEDELKRPSAKTKKQALDVVKDAATEKAVKISCDEDYRAESANLTLAIEEAIDAGCTDVEIKKAQDVWEIK